MPNKLDIGKAPENILDLSNYDILNEFILILESTGASRDTIKAYRSAVSDFIEFIGSKHLKEVTLKDIIAWRNTRLREGFEKSKSNDSNTWKTTIHYYSIFLNRFFEWLGLSIKVPKIPRPPRKIDVLSVDEINKLLNNVRDPLDTLLLKLLLNTGLRAKELLSIKVEDIDFNEKLIRVVNTKYGKERYVVVTSDTLETIRMWVKMNNLKPSDRLVNLTYSGLYKRLKSLAKRAGIPEWRVRPHVFRHTFATNVLRKGLSLTSLQRILGHSDIKTTQIYLHLTVSDVKREYEKVFENNVNQCSRCGREITINANYCPYCGFKLIREELVFST